MVAAAGALGVLARWAITPTGTTAAPWVTVAINVGGSFALGFLFAAAPSAQLRAVLGVGLLGSFTTFSTFAVDVATAAEHGRGARAVLLTAATVLVAVTAATAGLRLGAHLRIALTQPDP